MIDKQHPMSLTTDSATSAGTFSDTLKRLKQVKLPAISYKIT